MAHHFKRRHTCTVHGVKQKHEQRSLRFPSHSFVICQHTPIQFSAPQVFFRPQDEPKNIWHLNRFSKIFSRNKSQTYATPNERHLMCKWMAFKSNGNRVDFVCVVPCLQHAFAHIRCVLCPFSFDMVCTPVQVIWKMILH